MSNNYCQTIFEGDEPIVDIYSQEVKDSLGHVQYQPRQLTVSAQLIERIYYKHTCLTGTFALFDHRHQLLLPNKPFLTQVSAESSEATFTGDQRALGPLQMSNLTNGGNVVTKQPGINGSGSTACISSA